MSDVNVSIASSPISVTVDGGETVTIGGGNMISFNNLSELTNLVLARINLGATTVGANIFTLPNPSQVGFVKTNADNTVSAVTPSQAAALLPVMLGSNNLSDVVSASSSRTNLGGTTVGQGVFTLANPSQVGFVRTNADNTVTARTSAQVLSDLSALSSVNVKTFAASGTYTPTAGMKYCRVRIQAPGGGGGGADGVGTSSSFGETGAGGGGGEYAEGWFSAASIGASKTVTIGAVGTAGSDSGGDGGTGGTTSLVTLMTAVGGSGGTGSGSNATSSRTDAGGAGGTGGTGGSFRVPGGKGGWGMAGSFYDGTSSGRAGGCGGGAVLGSGAVPSAVAYSTGSDASGVNGPNYGGGGSGAHDNDTTGSAGGTGGAGIIIIEEFI